MTSAFGGQHSIQLSYGCVRFAFGRAGRALRGMQPLRVAGRSPQRL